MVCEDYHDLRITHHILIKGRFEVVPSLHVRVDIISNKGGGNIASPIPELGDLVIKDNCQSDAALVELQAVAVAFKSKQLC